MVVSVGTFSNNGRWMPTPAAYSGAGTQGTAMARHLAAGPRLDSFGCGASLGTGSSHHWTMGRRLWRGWACRLDFRAVRGSPPPSRGAAVEVEGGGAGTACHGRYRTRQLELEGGSSVCLGAVRHRPEPQWLPELPAPSGVCLQAPEEVPSRLMGPSGRLSWRSRTEEARRSGAKIFFADEAHFRADAELRGKSGLKGKPALVDSTSPRGEKASYYSAVCLETGEVEWMELEGNSNSGTSAAFLSQLRQGRAGPLRVIWDNARRIGARRCGSTCGRRVWSCDWCLPGYSPDFNADETAGVGRERRPLAICAWEAGRQCRRGSAIPGRADQPERRGETALPDSPAIKGRITPERHPAGITTPGKCASHLGFGLVWCIRSSPHYSEAF